MPYDPTKTIAVNEAYFAERYADHERRIGLLENPPKKPITIGLYGSSTPEHYVRQFGGTSYANDNVTVSTNGTTWTRLEAGRFAQELGTKLYQATGRPVRFLAFGIGGTTLAGWEGNSDGNLDRMGAAIQAAGGVDALFGQVGFNDLGANNPPSTAVHLALWRSLIAKIRNKSAAPNQVHFLGVTQDKNVMPQLAYARRSEMTVVNNDANVRFGANSADLETFDNIHQGEPSHVISASRFLPQILALINGTAQVRGPRMVSAAKVTDTTTDVTFVHGAGTGFNPTTATDGFAVYDPQGVLASGTVKGAAQSATVVRVTHPTGVNGITFANVPLSTLAPDSNMLKDNSIYGLPAEPSVDIVPIAGASAVTPVTISGTPAQASQGQSYTFTPTVGGGNGTYSFAQTGTALPTGFSFNTSTGAITAPANHSAAVGTTSGITITVSSAGQTASLSVSIAVVAGASATARMVKINAADPGSAASSDVTWNNIVSTNTTAVLKQPNGTTVPWTIVTNASSSGQSGVVTGNNTGVYPDDVMRTYWWTQNSTITTTIGALSNDKSYRVDIFGSRGGVTGRKVDYSIGAVTKTVDVSNNSTILASFENVTPTNGSIALTAVASTGSDQAYAYINAIVVTEPVGTPTAPKDAQVTFGADNSPDVAGWNVWRGQGSSLSAVVGSSIPLLSPSGSTTGWTLTKTTLDQGTAIQGATTGNNSGPYPDAAMANYWFNGDAGFGSPASTVTPSRLTLGGLTVGKTYTITLFGSRTATDRATTYTVNGTSMVQDNSNNTSRTSVFNNVVPDSAGKVTIDYERQKGPYGYINTLVVKEN